MVVYIMLISHLLVSRLWRNRNAVTFFIRMFSTASYIFKCTVIDVGPAGEFFNMVSGVVGSSSGLIWLMMSECQGWQLRQREPMPFHQACSGRGLWIKYERQEFMKVLQTRSLILLHCSCVTCPSLNDWCWDTAGWQKQLVLIWYRMCPQEN